MLWFDSGRLAASAAAEVFKIKNPHQMHPEEVNSQSSFELCFVLLLL